MSRALRFASAALLAASLALVSAPAAAAPMFPGPGDAGYDASLGDLAAGFQRQQDVFATLENGLSLDVYFLPTEVQGVRDFFAQTAVTDFQTFSGKHPFTVMQTFEEWGDEGNFAGISSVGVAARLMALRQSGASAAEIDAARASAVRVAQTWHVFATIGGPGVVARGVRRKIPENAGDPPLPGTLPDLVPLFDAKHHPLPKVKQPTWRAPVASGYDDWIWIDDTSKDQVSGYALASAWLWDALHDDPKVPAAVTDELANDLGAFAKSLMKVAPEYGIDLCIRDADGRLTDFHDLNPRQLSPTGSALPATSSLQNGFNAALALGVIRAAYHVTGDPEIGRYYYDQLVGARDFPHLALEFSGVVFVGTMTNYSNVNMLAIALATLGRFETDPATLSSYEDTLATQFWSTGSADDASHVKQAWFDVIWGAFSSKAQSDVPARMAADLGGFQPAPAIERDIENCDPTEIAAGVCTAIDGTTQIVLASGTGHGGSVEAKDIVPMSVRPDTDFAWRSDPHDVNGTGSTLMDPRGDWLTAYWLGRLLTLARPDDNRSPFARPPLAYSQDDGGGSGGAASTGASSGSGGSADAGGCGCRTVGGDGAAGALLALLGLVGVAKRRRRARR